jgi:hypothetical protein
MVNCGGLIGNTEYLTLYTRCCINRFRYNRVRLYATVCLLSEMWDASSHVDLVKIILNEIMHSTSLCEGTVSNVNWNLIVFLLKQVFFSIHLFHARRIQLFSASLLISVSRVALP